MPQARNKLYQRSQRGQCLVTAARDPRFPVARFASLAKRIRFCEPLVGAYKHRYRRSEVLLQNMLACPINWPGTYTIRTSRLQTGQRKSLFR